MPGENLEYLFDTLQRQLAELRDEARERDKETREIAKERHAENKLRLEQISARLDALERWRAYLVGAWAAMIAIITAIWSISKEWRPWSK